MCIYCNTDNYRKIYEHHYGQIPVELDGRTYEVHHIDGDHANNNPLNLTAITIQEHYDIHHAQGDLGACHAISLRLRKTSTELSRLATKHNLQRVTNGTHHFQKRADGTSFTGDRVKLGEHKSVFAKRADGTSIASDRVTNGTHHFQKRADGTSLRSDAMKSPEFINPFSKTTREKHHRYDPNVYVFKNLTTEEVVNMTQLDFREKYGVNVSEIVSGKRNVRNGWRLIKSD